MKHRRFLRQLVDDGYATLVPVSGVRAAIARALVERSVSKRLDNLSAIREALSRLL